MDHDSVVLSSLGSRKRTAPADGDDWEVSRRSPLVFDGEYRKSDTSSESSPMTRRERKAQRPPGAGLPRSPHSKHVPILFAPLEVLPPLFSNNASFVRLFFLVLSSRIPLP
jgi:hypothetical protein